MRRYAFGGGVSGATTRLRGPLGSSAETDRPAANTAVEVSGPATSIVAHDAVAAQQGIAAVPHGLGCPVFVAGSSFEATPCPGIEASPN